MNIFFGKKVSSIHCNFLITFLAYYSTNSVNFLLKNIHVSHSLRVIAEDVSSLLSKFFLNFAHAVSFDDRWNSFLKKKCSIASSAICLSLIFLIIFSNVFHILWIFSFGIKLQRSQQHFRPRTSTYFWQWDYLLIPFILTLLHFLRI